MWRGQCYQSLRTSCLEQGQLFVDPAFPHVTSDPEVDWKRPHEFCTDPKFIERGASTTDICQGELGNTIVQLLHNNYYTTAAATPLPHDNY
ncbi:hypothetical protein FKM82_028503 [Ascaphus truei]